MAYETTEQLKEFYAAHRQELYVYALSLTQTESAAEDAVHNAFSRVLARGTLPHELRPYLFRCVRNAALDEHRILARDGRHASILTGRNGKFVPPGGVRERIEMEELLNTLSPDERETIVMKIYTGMTFAEIAQVRSVPLATAASWYRRGLEKLRDRMGDTSDG